MDHPTEGTARTVDDQLRFVTRFAGENLDHFRAGDWMNLREEIRGFLQGPEEGAAPPLLVSCPPKQLTEASETSLRDLQRETRRALDNVVRVREAARGGASLSSVRLRDEQRWTPIPFAGAMMLSVFTSARDGFLLKAHVLLLQGGADNVRKCPECGRIFWRVGRQLYCSRECVNRANFRAYKSRNKPRTKSKTERKVR